MKGIVLLPLVPLRKNDSEESEMTSQLLFGEMLEILEVRERWLRVRNLQDDYEGWVDRKMVELIDEYPVITPTISTQPLAWCKNIANGDELLLAGGSVLNADNTLQVNDASYQLIAETKEDPNLTMSQQLERKAMLYLNAPYLWGGKTQLGIDCSGFVQVVFSMCGIQLPRDASEQSEKGFAIDSLTEVQTGDLAFFEDKSGAITHVGMLLNSSQIIHSSGWVKIETIDSHGIISSKNGTYTHQLSCIRRYF